MFSSMEYCGYYFVQFAIEINGRLRLVSLSLCVVIYSMLFHKESVLSVEIALEFQWKATASSTVFQRRISSILLFCIVVV